MRSAVKQAGAALATGRRCLVSADSGFARKHRFLFFLFFSFSLFLFEFSFEPCLPRKPEGLVPRFFRCTSSALTERLRRSSPTKDFTASLSHPPPHRARSSCA